jgi:putative mRNA 3-end processing factor
LFHYDRGLWITSIGLAVDIPRQQKLGFVSHAHLDHSARHELALCTHATGELLKARYGRITTKAIDPGKAVEWGDVKLEVFPAGHMLGSAMLLATLDGQRLLYTGDFRLGESLTAGQAAPPKADVLVMECTFGEPKYVFPPREEAVASLVGTIKTIRSAGQIAHIYAYAMGKAQEIVGLLTQRGFVVQVDRQTAAFCRAYESLGVNLGDYGVYGEDPREPDVILTPPRHQKGASGSRKGRRTIAVTGWAIEPAFMRRWGVDYAAPISDHADYNELLRLVEQVEPARVYCTHGTRRFVEDLRRRGIDAAYLDNDAGRRRR